MEKKKSEKVSKKQPDVTAEVKAVKHQRKLTKIQKQKTPLITKLALRIVTIISLAFVFFVAAYFSIKKISKVTTDNRYAMVDRQLGLCQELVSAKYSYNDIVTLKKSAGLAKSYSIVKYSGVIRTGLNDINEIGVDISKNGKTITLTIPKAQLLDNNLVSQEVFDEKQSIFVPITTQEIFEEIEEARIQAAEDLISDGILDEAQEQAAKVVRQFMYSAGFEDVVIKLK